MNPRHLANAAATAWSVAAVSYALYQTLTIEGSIPALMFKMAVVVAGSLGIAVLIGVDGYVGGLGWMGKTGVALVGVGVAISAVTFGAINFYILIQGIGYLVYGTALIRTHTAPTLSTVIVSGAFFTAPIVFLIADAAQISAPDSFGGRDLAFALGFLVAAAFMVTGLIGWGRWLAHPTKAEPISHTSA